MPAVTVEIETNVSVLMHVSHGYKITNPCLNGMRLNVRNLPNAVLRHVMCEAGLRSVCTVALLRNRNVMCFHMVNWENKNQCLYFECTIVRL